MGRPSESIYRIVRIAKGNDELKREIEWYDNGVGENGYCSRYDTMRSVLEEF